MALIYHRTLQCRVSESGEVTAVSVFGTDIERVVAGAEMLHEVWASLLEVCIASWLLERHIFLAFLAPLLLVSGKFWLHGHSCRISHERNSIPIPDWKSRGLRQ